MGVITISQEYTSSAPASKLFKALFLDAHNLIPKLLPQAIKSIDIEGDGGVGSIKKTNFAEGGQFKFMKHKIDALDTTNYYCKYTLIDGDMIGDKVESVVYEAKVEPSGEGCVYKVTSHYHTKGDNIKEDEIKAGKDKAAGIYKVVEEYLVANPNVYA